MIRKDADHIFSFLEGIEEGVLISRMKGKGREEFVFRNPALKNFIAETDLKKISFKDQIYSKDKIKFNNAINSALSTGLKKKIQIRMKSTGFREISWTELQINVKQEETHNWIYYFLRDINDEIESENLIKQSELKHRLLFTRANDAIFIIQNLQIIECNEKTLQMFESPGYSGISNKMLYHFMPEIQADGSDSILNFHYLIEEAFTGKPPLFYWIFKKFSGIQFEAEVSLSGFVVGEERFVQVIVRDITARRKAEQEELRAKIAEKANRELQKEIKVRIEAEEELKNAQQYTSSIINSSLDMIVASDKEGIITEFNQAAVKAFGYQPKEVIGKIVSELFVSQEESKRVLFEILEVGFFLGETICKTKSGELFSAYLSASLLFDNEGKSIGTVGVVKDISELKATEEKLKQNVEQKEVLIKEVHHRVKNNLQVINSILQLQSSHVVDQKALSALQDCQARIKSMAFIHESLYQSNDLAAVNFTEYIRTLCNNLLYSFQASGNAVKLDLQVEDVSLSLDAAISCGLIVNELISNSFKYAFEKGKKGLILVKLKKTREGHELIISDNGVGIPKNVDYKNSNSLGLQLVMGLVDQIDGKIDCEIKKGTKFIINFNRH